MSIHQQMLSQVMQVLANDPIALQAVYNLICANRPQPLQTFQPYPGMQPNVQPWQPNPQWTAGPQEQQPFHPRTHCNLEKLSVRAKMWFSAVLNDVDMKPYVDIEHAADSYFKFMNPVIAEVFGATPVNVVRAYSPMTVLEFRQQVDKNVFPAFTTLPPHGECIGTIPLLKQLYNDDTNGVTIVDVYSYQQSNNVLMVFNTTMWETINKQPKDTDLPADELLDKE